MESVIERIEWMLASVSDDTEALDLLDRLRDWVDARSIHLIFELGEASRVH